MRVPFSTTAIVFCSTAVACAILLAVSAAFAQDTNFATGPQYLMNHGSRLFAQPISTPSLSLAGPPLQIGATTATAGLRAGAEMQTMPSPSATLLPEVDLFPIFYGDKPGQAITVRFRENSPSRDQLPSSIQDSGGSELTTPQALRERGFGLTLGEAARESRARLRHAIRHYTNHDIGRLHGG